MKHFSHVHHVHFDETNLVGNVYFANYVRWQGHCRERFLFENAPTVVADIYARTLALITVNAHVDYYYEAFAGDIIDIRMYAKESSGSRLSMRFEYIRSETRIASGSQTVACASLNPVSQLMESCPIPRPLLAAFEDYGG